jgi:hypothetical protein
MKLAADSIALSGGKELKRDRTNFGARGGVQFRKTDQTVASGEGLL